MINAEIHCDIVLESFVPKVVPQPRMPPNKSYISENPWAGHFLQFQHKIAWVA
jgi:hypothetical protein